MLDLTVGLFRYIMKLSRGSGCTDVQCGTRMLFFGLPQDAVLRQSAGLITERAYTVNKEEHIQTHTNPHTRTH